MCIYNILFHTYYVHLVYTLSLSTYSVIFYTAEAGRRTHSEPASIDKDGSTIEGIITLMYLRRD